MTKRKERETEGVDKSLKTQVKAASQAPRRGLSASSNSFLRFSSGPVE
jgi:hypothetical protein